MRILKKYKLVFVAKPRCASTSVRLILSKFVDIDNGDIVCNLPCEESGLHPHMPAPLISNFISSHWQEDPKDYTFFTVTRDPFDMLLSYYRFFKPDTSMRYTFDKNHNPDSLIPLDLWLSSGSTNFPRKWMASAPSFIRSSDFSGLSLESRAFDSMGRCRCQSIFKIEEASMLEDFLADKLKSKVELPRVNQSKKNIPNFARKLSPMSIKRALESFPLERAMYPSTGIADA